MADASYLLREAGRPEDARKMQERVHASGDYYTALNIINEYVDCVFSAHNTLLVQSQLHLVDLAGSERVKKSKVTGARMREAVGINSSLLVLGKVISALVKSHSHVPYLESKLTTLLKAAFGGNARTMVTGLAQIMIEPRTDTRIPV